MPKVQLAAGVVALDLFSPAQEQFDCGVDILEDYEKATEADGIGAVIFGNEMIDEASRKIATKFVTPTPNAPVSKSCRSSPAEPSELTDIGSARVWGHGEPRHWEDQ